MFQERFRKHDENGASGAVVAAESRGTVGNDAAALPPRLNASAEQHRVEMGREQQAWSWSGSRQIHDQVTRFRGSGNTLIRIVETDGGSRHASLLQRFGDGSRDPGFMPGHALNGQKPHQVIFRGGDIKGKRKAVHRFNSLHVVVLSRCGERLRLIAPKEARAFAKGRKAQSRE
jgi:hypothetical protein